MANKELKVGNVPNLRFPGFEGEWEVKKLGEIGEIVNGLTYNPNDINENGVLVLRSSNVQNRNIVFDDNVYVKVLNYNQVKENDILICVRNGSKNLIGKNALIKKENEGLAFGAFMSVYRSPFNQFIFQWFDTQKYKETVNKNLGATINSINGGDLKSFSIALPSKEEQKKIADFLSLLDLRIQTQNKIIEELKLLKNTLNKQLFSRELRFKDDNDYSFGDWKNIMLGDIGQIITGKTPSTADLDLWDGDIQFVTPTDIRLDKYQYTTERTIKKTDKLKILPPKSIMFTCIASIGKMSLSLKPCVTNQQINSLIPNSDFNNEFVFYAIANISGFIKSIQASSTMPIINKTEFSKFKISIPPPEEQLKIANFLSSFDSKINIELQLLQKLEVEKNTY
ncbi:restriction endonuclease subunit S [Flavobacterium sp. J372]|uniref:restriction endonuclease subunit S n=1 Tax=Flavobacterium sp. J372 TaxID=2898436 RepID=UPI002151871D|nr:restriction endonuclease subunit S [Flavobacterium sp. J372]MCR5862688.1 restriction endonuclease subunit S [Flavobacterium sp. J372]